MSKKIFATLVFALIALKAFASTTLVIYSQGFALINEQKEFLLSKGINELKINVSNDIVPESVFVLAPEGVQVISYSIIPREEKKSFLDKNVEVRVYTDSGVFQGILLENYSDAVLIDANGKLLYIRDFKILETEKRKNLGTLAKLEIEAFAERKSRGKFEISYLSNGLSWKANYMLLIEDDRKAKLDCWANIQNNTDKNFKNAQLLLFSGKINRVYSTNRYVWSGITYKSEAGSGASKREIEPRNIFEYYKYNIPYEVSLRAHEKKQISLLAGRKISYGKKYLFEPISNWGYRRYSQGSFENARIIIELENTKANNLGFAMPEGTMRIYKRDSNNKLVLLGESNVSSTPKGEKLRIYIGNAFDVIARKKQVTESKVSENCRKKSFEVEIINKKNEDINAIVPYRAYGSITITSSNYKPVKKDAYTYEFYIPVKANNKETLTFEALVCY